MSQERRERGEKRGERGAKAGGSERTSFSLSCLAAATSCSRCASMAARSCSACATACPACIASSSAFARFLRACRVVAGGREQGLTLGNFSAQLETSPTQKLTRKRPLIPPNTPQSPSR